MWFKFYQAKAHHRIMRHGLGGIDVCNDSCGRDLSASLLAFLVSMCTSCFVGVLVRDCRRSTGIAEGSFLIPRFPEAEAAALMEAHSVVGFGGHFWKLGPLDWFNKLFNSLHRTPYQVDQVFSRPRLSIRLPWILKTKEVRASQKVAIHLHNLIQLRDPQLRTS